MRDTRDSCWLSNQTRWKISPILTALIIQAVRSNIVSTAFTSSAVRAIRGALFVQSRIGWGQEWWEIGSFCPRIPSFRRWVTMAVTFLWQAMFTVCLCGCACWFTECALGWRDRSPWTMRMSRIDPCGICLAPERLEKNNIRRIGQKKHNWKILVPEVHVALRVVCALAVCLWRCANWALMARSCQQWFRCFQASAGTVVKKHVNTREQVSFQQQMMHTYIYIYINI